MQDADAFITPAAGDHVLRWPGTGTDALTLCMTPERALWWPAMHTLFVADVHLGKAAVFRSRGLPVPRGTTTATLARLSKVLRRTAARRLVVLGDFLHARESHAQGTMAALHRWRQDHADIECVVVQGNHDKHAGPLCAELRFTQLASPWAMGAVIGVHAPHEAPPMPTLRQPPCLVLAGHQHPVVYLKDRLDQLRLPCFALRGHILTLPAFGAFTGGHAIDRAEARVFLVTEDAVIPL